MTGAAEGKADERLGQRGELMEDLAGHCKACGFDWVTGGGGGVDVTVQSPPPTISSSDSGSH